MRYANFNNVRCFADPGEARIAPLTILVGENSTGKSSFLALLRIAMDMLSGNFNPNFNSEPFLLGAYDQIAHYRGGRFGRSQSFNLNLRTTFRAPRNVNSHNGELHAFFSGKFVKKGSQPRLSKLTFDCDPYYSVFDIEDNGHVKVSLKTEKGEMDGTADIGRFSHLSLGQVYMPWPLLYMMMRENTEKNRKNFGVDEFERFRRLWEAASEQFARQTYAIAPVRTKPERTYNPIDDTRKSEGQHVPMILAKTFFTDHTQWDRLTKALDRFGRASGLFDEIKLKGLGPSDSDPFQILIKIAGPYSNLIDVGYGVSQVLPILVDLINDDASPMYLLQQPEVHLHPKAQAELGTFICELVKPAKRSIVMETHSDYIIDRVRMNVRSGFLHPESVSILFFERNGLEVSIHQMDLDTEGNFSTVPATYRTFFLEEEGRLLGV